MSGRLARVRRWLVALLLPQRCCLCGQVIDWQDHLCTACREEAPWILPPVCPLCGRREKHCGCGGRSRHFERCVSALGYEGRGQDGIRRLKETGDACTVEGLAAEAAEVLRREYGGLPFTLVTAVPQHPADARRRGHDPAGLLAAAIARQIGVPYVPTLCKIRRTRPQKELSAAARQSNLLGAFAVRGPVLSAARRRPGRKNAPVSLDGAVVLLTDDVVTTGATLDECAKTLKLAGAAAVYAVTAAATEEHAPDGSTDPLQNSTNDV